MTALTSSDHQITECSPKKYHVYYKLIQERKQKINKMIVRFETNNNNITFENIKSHMHNLKLTDKDISNLQFFISKKSIGKKINTTINNQTLLIEIKPKNIEIKKILDIFTENSIILKNERKREEEKKRKKKEEKN